MFPKILNFNPQLKNNTIISQKLFNTPNQLLAKFEIKIPIIYRTVAKYMYI